MAKYPSCEIGAYYAIMRSARILDDLERIGVSGRRRGLCASGRGLGLGHGGRLAAAAICRPRRAGAGARRRNARRRPTTPSGSSRSTRTSIRPISTKCMWALSTRCNPARRPRHPAQHLVDRPRSQPVSAGGAALRLEGADRRLQAAPAIKQFPASTLLRRAVYEPHGQALAGVRLRRAAAKADQVPRRVAS